MINIKTVQNFQVRVIWSMINSENLRKKNLKKIIILIAIIAILTTVVLAIIFIISLNLNPQNSDGDNGWPCATLLILTKNLYKMILMNKY